MFFESCKSLTEIKNRYHRLALLLHPDKGGDNELFVILQNYYEKFKGKKFEKEKGNEKANFIFENDPKLQIIDKIYKKKCYLSPKTFEFFISVVDFLENKKYITIKQYESLFRILKRLEKIDEE